jgi:hypothetical protein
MLMELSSQVEDEGEIGLKAFLLEAFASMNDLYVGLSRPARSAKHSDVALPAQG